MGGTDVRHLLRRAAFLLLTGWAALTMNFILPRMMPGNPAQAVLAKYQGKLTPEALDAMSIAFGLDTSKSLVGQYLEYWVRMLKGDLGLSLNYYPLPVREVLAQSIPWTIGLVGTATLIAFMVGTLCGIFSAWRRNSVVADAAVPIALFFNSVPYFWLSLLLLYLFAYLLGWFPIGGGYDVFSEATGWARISSVVHHSILPIGTIVLTASGGWLLTMRNNMMSVQADDYVAFARAKGLRDRDIMFRYAARNAILPSFTGFSMALGFVVGGSLLTEIVFSYPGIGYILYQAVTSLDYPLMQAVFLFISLAVLGANFIADLVYAVLDPRVQEGGEEM